MMYSKTIDYRGHRIHRADYSNLDEEEVIKAMRHNTQENLDEGERDLLLMLILEGVNVSKNVLKANIELAPKIRPHLKKTAVVGLAKIQHLFINYIISVFAIDVRAFEDETEAKEWLIS